MSANISNALLLPDCVLFCQVKCYKELQSNDISNKKYLVWAVWRDIGLIPVCGKLRVWISCTTVKYHRSIRNSLGVFFRGYNTWVHLGIEAITLLYLVYLACHSPDAGTRWAVLSWIPAPHTCRARGDAAVRPARGAGSWTRPPDARCSRSPSPTPGSCAAAWACRCDGWTCATCSAATPDCPGTCAIKTEALMMMTGKLLMSYWQMNVLYYQHGVIASSLQYNASM